MIKKKDNMQDLVKGLNKQSNDFSKGMGNLLDFKKKVKFVGGKK